ALAHGRVSNLGSRFAAPSAQWRRMITIGVAASYALALVLVLEAEGRSQSSKADARTLSARGRGRGRGADRAREPRSARVSADAAIGKRRPCIARRNPPLVSEYNACDDATRRR